MTYDSRVNCRFKRVGCGRAIVHLFVILFGISTWIGVNGIFVELPLLIDIAPESWNLPAYVVIVTQAANVGPAIYGCLYKCKYQLNESLCILCLMCLHVLAIGTLIFYENTKVLLIAVFFSALVGCFSSVLFMPHLRDFDHIFIISYFIGEGLSGVLPSIAALIQGTEMRCNITVDDPIGSVPANMINSSRSSGRYYFSFLTLVLASSLVAFLLLRYSSFVRSRKNNSNFSTRSDIQLVNYKRHNEHDAAIIARVNDRTSPKKESECIPDDSRMIEGKVTDLPVFRRTYFYILIGIYCFFSIGFLPSIQSYSCLPYGQFAYQLSVTCVQFVNPFACFLVLWITVSDLRVINCLSLICLLAGCYVICVALLSPTPPLRNSTVGVLLLVLIWSIAMGLMSYLKLVIVSLLKRASCALFNIGMVLQAGAAAGAIVSFVLINFTDYFKTYDGAVQSGGHRRDCVQ